MKPYQRAIVLVVSLSALIGLAEAQPLGRFPWTARGVTFTASEGRVLYVDARSLGPGHYYFVVRVTVARDVKASPDDRVMFPSMFKFVAEDGVVYRYSPRVIYPHLPRFEQCPSQERYLLPGTAITCDLIFLVPSNVTRGTVEVSPPNAPPVPITIRE